MYLLAVVVDLVEIQIKPLQSTVCIQDYVHQISYHFEPFTISRNTITKVAIKQNLYDSS